LSGIESRLSAPHVDLAYAIIGHSDALLAAIRRRINELQLSHETVESISGAMPGYISKILGSPCSPPAKRIQLYLACILVEALGLEIRLYENPQAMERLERRFEKRKLKKASVRAAMRKIELMPDFYRHISGLAADARRRKISPERRSQLASHAATARWRKARGEEPTPDRHLTAAH
jgi:hypothetical protein